MLSAYFSDASAEQKNPERQADAVISESAYQVTYFAEGLYICSEDAVSGNFQTSFKRGKEDTIPGNVRLR